MEEDGTVIHQIPSFSRLFGWQRMFTYENKRKHIFISEADEGFCEKLVELYDTADSFFSVLREFSFYPFLKNVFSSEYIFIISSFCMKRYHKWSIRKIRGIFCAAKRTLSTPRKYSKILCFSRSQ